MADYFYDSADQRLTIKFWVRRLWRHRGLVWLLVSRELRVRYKRSLLGVWWTLLSPVLEMGALAVVFSHVFRYSSSNVPYIVYLLSGIIVASLIRNVILLTSSSLSVNAQTLARIRVPPEVFSVAAALGVGTNFLVSLLPLLAIMIISGASISATVPLIIAPIGLVMILAWGVGLALAPAVARFNDVLPLTAIILGLVTYLAPVFYPFRIVPSKFRPIIEVNPLYHALNIFRDILYSNGSGAAGDYLILTCFAVGAVVCGTWVFARGSRNAIAQL